MKKVIPVVVEQMLVLSWIPLSYLKVEGILVSAYLESPPHGLQEAILRLTRHIKDDILFTPPIISPCVH